MSQSAQYSHVHTILQKQMTFEAQYNKNIKVTQFFGRVPSYSEALWYPHLYFYRQSNTQNG